MGRGEGTDVHVGWLADVVVGVEMGMLGAIADSILVVVLKEVVEICDD